MVRTLIEALDIEGVVFTLDALHMPCLCVVTAGVKVFKDLYERIYERTGMKMKGYVAVQKKLLTTMYALWRRNEAFDPEYGQQLSASESEAEFSSRHSSTEDRANKKLALSEQG